MAKPEPKNRKLADVGIVLCDCCGELRDRIDFGLLRKELIRLPAVLSVKVCSEFCDNAKCSAAVMALAKAGAKRLVVGACSRGYFENHLRRVLKKEKINDAMWTSVNIREQSALVHRNRKIATAKSLGRLVAAVNRVQLAVPVKSKQQKIRQDVIVVGGGIAGMRASVTLARLGHCVTLINRNKKNGGVVASMPELYGYVDSDSISAVEDVTLAAERFARDLNENRNITLCLQTSVKSIDGELGNFLVTVTSKGKDRQLEAGAVVLATGSGCKSALETSGLSGKPGITDMAGLMKKIRDHALPDRVAVILETGKGNGRAVFAQALSAAELMAREYRAKVKLFCDNVQVGVTGLEQLYTRAREAGVVVIKSEKQPAISIKNSKVIVKFDEKIAGITISEEFDLAVMAGCVSHESDLCKSDLVPGLRPGPDNSLQYDNVWLLPTLTNRPGVFVAGGARGNSEYREALIDGSAAADKIHEMLGAGKIEVRNDAAVVDTDKCVLCLTCLRICPYGAISIDYENDAAYVSSVSCQRCGICAAECPAKAISLPGFTDEQISADVGVKPRVTVFACENSAIPAADAAALIGYTYGPEIQLVRVPCTGKVDPCNVLEALESGADKVLILGCYPENCKYLNGSTRAEKRIERLNEILGKAGFDKSRVSFGGLASVEPAKFIDYVKEETKS